VSGAELLVALKCGISPDRIVYSGVAKTDAEIDRAIACGPRGIAAVQIESLEEIARVAARGSAARRRVRVSLRINPSLELGGATHAHITTGHDGSKFGVPRGDAARAVGMVEGSPHLELVGMSSHVGSHFTTTAPYVEAANVLFAFVRSIRTPGRLPSLSFVNTGGGFGVDYVGRAPDESPVPVPADFVGAARAAQRAAGLADLALYVEPGRSMVAAHGILVAKVIQVKVAATARWLMIDAGMNDLIRPALYQARHRIVPLEGDGGPAAALPWRVVGPVCESSDDFGEHLLPREPASHVAILDCGAYGYTMASRYNGRQVPVEVFLRGGSVVGRTERTPIEQWADERVRAGS
jgi:diaminopimelate decarboxylase